MPRELISVFLITAFLIAASACGSVSDPDEARARATLARNRMTAISLTRVDERVYDFTGTLDGASCAGTVVLNSPTTAAMSFECD